jgi:hypothetical protein
LLVAIGASYVFIISAGTWKTWGTWNTNYDLIAEGFRAGHLYIVPEPPAELLARPNPFDYANSNLWFLDASLYKRHYYLYWGPLPALVVAGVKIVLRIKSVVGDQYVTFASYVLLLLAGALLIDRMTRRLFPALGRPFVLLATVAFAYATPTPFMLATPGIYEAAIAACQSLLLIGLVPAFAAVWDASERAPSRVRLLAASLCWTGAIACRVSAVLPVAVFVLLTAALSSTAPGPKRWRRALASATLMGAPIATGGLALLAYNKARFDSWFEIGVKYQLNVFPFVTSRSFLPLNLWSYLFRPVGLACRFPFVSALYDIGEHGFWRGVRFPAGYTSHEPQAGLFVTAPWTWLTVVALVLVVRGLVRWRRAADHSFTAVVADQRARVQLWCLASFAALAFLMPLVFVTAFGTTMRYVADFSPGMVLLGVWGGWSLLGLVRRPWPRRSVIALLIALAAATAIVGFLLGFSGYDEMFKNNNHELYESLRHRFSFCR